MWDNNGVDLPARGGRHLAVRSLLEGEMSPRTTTWRSALRPFARVVLRRLGNGAHEYGDRSLTADPGRLLAELAEEASDLAAWGYLLWRRIDALRRQLETATHCPLCGADHAAMSPPRKETVVI